MATKNNPGKFDCYENAEPDEPMFVLLARDDSAAAMTRAWVHARKGEVDAAIYWIKVATLAGSKKDRPNVAKMSEAFACADAMEAWLKARNPYPPRIPTHRGGEEMTTFEPGSEDFDREIQPLVSIALSLKRIADALNEINQYGEGPAAAIGGNIARAMAESWRR